MADDDDDGGTRKDNTHTHTTQQQTERVREDTGAPVGSTRSSDGDRLVPLHVYTQIEPRGGGGRDGRAEGPMRGSRAGSFFASTDGLGGRRRWTHVVPYTTRKTLRGEQLQPSTLSSG